MSLTLSDLDTRLGVLVGDTSSGAQTNRRRAIADADVDLSAIRGYWRVRLHDYTSSSSPAMTANSNQLSVPTSPAFEAPYRLFYRDNGLVHDVRVISYTEWLTRSDTSRADAPTWATVVQTASALRLDLDVQLSSTFVTQIGTLTLAYLAEITRMSSGSDTSVLPDSLRQHILPVAGYQYALSQGDLALARELKSDAELAREAVLRWDLDHLNRPRQLRPATSYAPADSDEDGVTSDYRSG